MERKTYTIFDSYDVCSAENFQEAKENIIDNAFFDCNEDGTITVTDNFGKEVTLTREEYGKALTDDKIYAECYEQNSMWFSGAESELNVVDSGNILIAIADLGRWNGRCSGYKIINSLACVLYTECDYERVFVDSNGDLRKEESHHDGNNSILYRYWKEGLTEGQKENFLNKIYNGKVTQRDITRYTRKAGLAIADVYGWKVRGSENKYKKVA